MSFTAEAESFEESPRRRVSRIRVCNHAVQLHTVEKSIEQSGDSFKRESATLMGALKRECDCGLKWIVRLHAHCTVANQFRRGMQSNGYLQPLAGHAEGLC